MVTLYTWIPLMPHEAVPRSVLADFGHSVMEVTRDGETRAYVSFWPEKESLVGELTYRWKPRSTRHPTNYAEESDLHGAFMQRPAEYHDEITGLDEESIIEARQTIQNSAYDVRRWNCSNVTRFLLVRAMAPDAFVAIRDAAKLSPKQLQQIQGVGDLREKIRFFATASLLTCRPDDVRRLVQAYKTYQAKGS
jgi:hypothetical protein